MRNVYVLNIDKSKIKQDRKIYCKQTDRMCTHKFLRNKILCLEKKEEAILVHVINSDARDNIEIGHKYAHTSQFVDNVN